MGRIADGRSPDVGKDSRVAAWCFRRPVDGLADAPPRQIRGEYERPIRVFTDDAVEYFADGTPFASTGTRGVSAASVRLLDRARFLAAVDAGLEASSRAIRNVSGGFSAG